MKNFRLLSLLVLSVLLLIGCSDSEGVSSSENIEDIAPRSSAPTTDATQWYVSITATAPDLGMRDISAKFGEMISLEEAAKQTLLAKDPLGASFIDVVFINPLGVSAGEYKSSYNQHVDGQEQSWDFTVKIDDGDENDKSDLRAVVVLHFKGVYDLIASKDELGRTQYKGSYSVNNPIVKRMKLIDLNTSEEVSLNYNGELGSFDFEMEDSHERTLRLVLEAEGTAASQAPALHSQAVRPAEKAPYIKLEKKQVTFDLMTPPKF